MQRWSRTNEEDCPEQKSWYTMRMSVLVEKIKKDKRDPWGPVHSLESLRKCETLKSLKRKVEKFDRIRLMKKMRSTQHVRTTWKRMTLRLSALAFLVCGEGSL